MTLSLTDAAAQKILSLINEEPKPEDTFFRVLISGGGCAGFQYSFSLDDTLSEGDQVFEDKGIKIVLDDASLSLVEGAEIDYVEELIGASFQIKNPNAATSCGCGNSFSI